jgi:hypothetical protein
MVSFAKYGFSLRGGGVSERGPNWFRDVREANDTWPFKNFQSGTNTALVVPHLYMQRYTTKCGYRVCNFYYESDIL